LLPATRGADRNRRWREEQGGEGVQVLTRVTQRHRRRDRLTVDDDANPVPRCRICHEVPLKPSSTVANQLDADNERWFRPQHRDHDVAVRQHRRHRPRSTVVVESKSCRAVLPVVLPAHVDLTLRRR